jgi:hypothetical protein
LATIYDLIEVTNISPDTTYSAIQGNYLGVVDGMVSTDLDDGEFDQGDVVTIGGVDYTIDLIQEPLSSGRFTLTDGTSLSFDPQSEANLSATFLTLSNGVDTRYFIIPNDSYGDMSISEIRTGSLETVAGNDSAIQSTTDNNVSVVCFANGTLILSADGQLVPVEDLRVGDLVETLDHGAQQIVWTGVRSVSPSQLMARPELRPVKIGKGALGNNTPDQPLLVSQQHRVFVRSKIANRMFGTSEVLVPAKQLLGLDGISISDRMTPVDYHHFMFQKHEIIFANKALCESLYPGEQALKTLRSLATTPSEPKMDAVDTLSYAPSRTFAKGAKARRLTMRHKKNARALVYTPEGNDRARFAFEAEPPGSGAQI